MLVQNTQPFEFLKPAPPLCGEPLALPDGPGFRMGHMADRTGDIRSSAFPTLAEDQIGELAQAGVEGVVLSAGLDPETAVRVLREFSREVAPRLAERGHQG